MCGVLGGEGGCVHARLCVGCGVWAWVWAWVWEGGGAGRGRGGGEERAIA